MSLVWRALAAPDTALWAVAINYPLLRLIIRTEGSKGECIKYDCFLIGDRVLCSSFHPLPIHNGITDRTLGCMIALLNGRPKSPLSLFVFRSGSSSPSLAVINFYSLNSPSLFWTGAYNELVSHTLKLFVTTLLQNLEVNLSIIVKSG